MNVGFIFVLVSALVRPTFKLTVSIIHAEFIYFTLYTLHDRASTAMNEWK